MPEAAVPGDRPPGNPVAAAEVRTMFDRIAPIYDLMNTVMTAGLDARWRRAAVLAAEIPPGGAAVDVACGTGPLTRALARAVGAAGSVTGVDVSAGMLAHARRRAGPDGSATPRYLRADALALPLPDAMADATTIGFGLRNVADYLACLREMIRVTRPGGLVVVLEIAMPERGMGRLIATTWFERVVPLLGRLVGAGAAYGYLPRSVRTYPAPVEVARAMAAAGAVDVRWHRLAPGLVTLHVGRRAEAG